MARRDVLGLRIGQRLITIEHTYDNAGSFLVAVTSEHGVIESETVAESYADSIETLRGRAKDWIDRLIDEVVDEVPPPVMIPRNMVHIEDEYSDDYLRDESGEPLDTSRMR